MKGDKRSLVLLSSKRTKAYSKTRADEAFALPFFPEATPISKVDSYSESQLDKAFAFASSPEVAPMLKLKLLQETCKNGTTGNHLGKGMEEVKETILQHESAFREQLHELHRLYQVQQVLMEQSGCKYSETNGASGSASADSSIVYSSSPCKPTEATPSTPKISFSPAANVAISNSAELSFCQGHLDVENSAEAPQHAEASLATSCRKVNRRLFDLERPAEDYMDVEAEEDTAKTVGQVSPSEPTVPLISAGPSLSSRGSLGEIPDLNCECLPEGNLVQSTMSYSDGTEQTKELQLLSLEDEGRLQKGIPKAPRWLVQGMSVDAHSLSSPYSPSVVRRHEVLDLPINQKKCSSNNGKDPCLLPCSVIGYPSRDTVGMHNLCAENNATSLFLAPEMSDPFGTSTRQPWFRQNTFSALMQQMHQRPPIVSPTRCSIASQGMQTTDAAKDDDFMGRVNGMLDENVGHCKVYSGPLVTRLENSLSLCVGESTPKADLQLSLGTIAKVKTRAQEAGSPLWTSKTPKSINQHGLPLLNNGFDPKLPGGVAHPSNKSQLPFSCFTEESEHSLRMKPLMGLPQDETFNGSPLCVSNVNSILKRQHIDKAPLPFIAAQAHKQHRSLYEPRDSQKRPSLFDGSVLHVPDIDTQGFQEHRQATVPGAMHFLPLSEGLLAGKSSETLVVTVSRSKEGGAVSSMRSRDDSSTSCSVACDSGQQAKIESMTMLQSGLVNKSCESSNALKVLEQEESVVEGEIGDGINGWLLRKPLGKVLDHTDQAAEILLSLASDFSRPLENRCYGAPPCADRSLNWFSSLIPQDDNSEVARKKCMPFTQNICHGAQSGVMAIDLFESATLMLKAVSPDSEKLSVKVLDACQKTGDFQSFPSLRRSSRRRRVGRDFQRGLLASVVSVSRQETTEDLQIIEGLIRSAAEITEKPPVFSTGDGEEESSVPKSGSCSKKKHGPATSKGPISGSPKVCEMENQDGLLRIYSWGEATRRRCLRRQRNRWSFLPSAVYKPSHLGKA